jgi:hypothetical protein
MKFPPIEDETALRATLQQAGEILQAISAITPTKFDDLALSAFEVLVNNDQAWAVFYTLLRFVAAADDLSKLVDLTGLPEDQILQLRDAVLDQSIAAGLNSGFGTPRMA